MFYAYDYYDHRIKAFDTTGALRWTFGGEGSGPHEFSNPMDLDVADDGSVWIWDARNQRIAAISSGGVPKVAIPVSGIRGKDMTPYGSGAILTLVEEERFAIVVDSLGNVVQQIPFPLERLEGISPFVRQTISSTAPDGSSWAVAFPLGSHLVLFDGTSLRCTVRLIEAGDFPVPNQEGPVWAAAIASTDSSVYVLAKGLSRDALRMVDEYSSESCRYRRTMRLPGRYVTFAVSDGTFFFEHEDPAPTIVALRLHRD